VEYCQVSSHLLYILGSKTNYELKEIYWFPLDNPLNKSEVIRFQLKGGYTKCYIHNDRWLVSINYFTVTSTRLRQHALTVYTEVYDECLETVSAAILPLTDVKVLMVVVKFNYHLWTYDCLAKEFSHLATVQTYFIEIEVPFILRVKPTLLKLVSSSITYSIDLQVLDCPTTSGIIALKHHQGIPLSQRSKLYEDGTRFFIYAGMQVTVTSKAAVYGLKFKRLTDYWVLLELQKQNRGLGRLHTSVMKLAVAKYCSL
jgi:hypothetical protein